VTNRREPEGSGELCTLAVDFQPARRQDWQFVTLAPWNRRQDPATNRDPHPPEDLPGCPAELRLAISALVTVPSYGKQVFSLPPNPQPMTHRLRLSEPVRARRSRLPMADGEHAVRLRA
jgi:hypothetical protein